MVPKFVGVTGLPRSGSTLLCQLLGQHPEVYSDGRSSPLCNTLITIRRMVSDDVFFLSQLDMEFSKSYGHLASAMQGYLRGWHHDCQSPMVVDKSRGWLRAIELLLNIDPDAKLIVCLRDLGQIYGSIEAQHQRTILLDFSDHLADFDRFSRADQLFMKDKVIGSPLTALHAVADLPKEVQARLYYLRFEDLMDRPAACLKHLFDWLGVAPFDIELENLRRGSTESDSHYRMKYLHNHQERIAPPGRHEIPAKIQTLIDAAYPWYSQMFYPTK